MTNQQIIVEPNSATKWRGCVVELIWVKVSDTQWDSKHVS